MLTERAYLRQVPKNDENKFVFNTFPASVFFMERLVKIFISIYEGINK